MEREAFLKILKQAQEHSVEVDRKLGVNDDLDGFSGNMLDIASGKASYDRRLHIQSVEPEADHVRIQINTETSAIGYLANQRMTSADF